MKNKFLLKKILSILPLIAITSMSITEIMADAGIPATTLKKALNLTGVDETTGCTLLSSAGELLKPLSSSEKGRACVTCGDNWAKDEKNNGKALTVVCGKTGSPTDKQKEILTRALTDCEQLALLYRRFDLLSKDQRVQAVSTCFGKWDQHPKARNALMKQPVDLDESKEVKGDLPTWQEVSQMQILAKADAKGQVTQEITEEQFKAVIK